MFPLSMKYTLTLRYKSTILCIFNPRENHRTFRTSFFFNKNVYDEIKGEKKKSPIIQSPIRIKKLVIPESFNENN